MMWPDNWRLKYGRERAKITLKKEEAQAKQSMWKVSDTIIFWDFWIVWGVDYMYPVCQIDCKKKPLKNDLSLKSTWNERSHVCMKHAAVKLNLISRVSELTSDEYRWKWCVTTLSCSPDLELWKKNTPSGWRTWSPHATIWRHKEWNLQYVEEWSDIGRWQPDGMVCPMVVTPKPNGKVRVCVECV